MYQADPLVCKGCGGPLKIVAYVTDELSIRRILDHLGLSPPEQEKPPPAREVVRVPVDDERREIQEIPSGEVKLNREFDVSGTNALTITLDFDGDRSIRETGNGCSTMNPVISVVSVQ